MHAAVPVLACASVLIFWLVMATRVGRTCNSVRQGHSEKQSVRLRVGAWAVASSACLRVAVCVCAWVRGLLRAVRVCMWLCASERECVGCCEQCMSVCGCAGCLCVAVWSCVAGSISLELGDKYWIRG